MTEEKFNEGVRNGLKLVILDECVLDVGGFIAHHPGGQFVLTHNIGRDISKFFHGGYSLDGNMGANPRAGYAHSNYARFIVNDLIIAQFDRQKDPVRTTLCTLDDRKSFQINATTKTLYLTSTTNAPVSNFKRFYPGLNNLGKHFLVSTTHGNKPARHYTVCNVMNPPVYQQLIRLLRGDTDDFGPLVQGLNQAD